jgi:methylmalonyl-CoA mutase
LPIIGVNTYLNPRQDEISGNLNIELARASYEEKDARLKAINEWKESHEQTAQKALERLKHVALVNGNVFEELLNTARVATLGQMTQALYAVGGQYRRAL